MNLELTNQQKEALNKAKNWWKTKYKQTFEISGIAGSGKTTIVYSLIESIGLKHDEVLFMAFVGKATLALARKGNYAQTIHSTIYDFSKKVNKSISKIDLENEKIKYDIVFTKKDRLPKNIKLLVVDEAGMVSESIARDILSYDIPVIALGDNNQLDPVFGERYFLKNPDITLTEPMRQALDSPIIYLAQQALKGKYIKRGNYNNECFVIDKSMITDNMLIKSDIVLCGTNKMRHKLNKQIREDILKIDNDLPVIGDKLICRKNNWRQSIDNNIFLINGMVGYVDDIYLESYKNGSINIDFRPDFLDDEYFDNIRIDLNHIKNSSGPTSYNRFNKSNVFEYGYAITVHLSQGSEWDKVFLYDDCYGSNDYRRKLLYTAITRSKKNLIIAM